MSDPADRVWRAHRRWSLAANRAKSELDWSRRLTLLPAVVAAFAGAAAVGTGWSVLAGVSAAATAVAAVFAARTGGAELRGATRLRAVSEALKAEVYMYLARAGRYRGDDRDVELDRRSAELLADDEGIGVRVARQRPDASPLPAVHDAKSYVDIRLTGQLDGYYRPRAARLAGWATRFHYAQFTLTVLGGTLAGVAAAGDTQVAGWIGALTTAATAVAAHSAAARHEYLALTYDRTAQHLEALRDRWSSGRLGDDVVTECEKLLAVQNDAWLAQWNTAEGGV